MSAERREAPSEIGKDVISISRKERRRGDDGHRALMERLDALATRTDRSRNERMNLLLAAALDRVVIPDQE